MCYKLSGNILEIYEVTIVELKTSILNISRIKTKTANFSRSKKANNILGLWKQIGRIPMSVAACLLVGYAGNWALPGTGKIVFVGKIVGYTVFYAAVIYKTAMNEEEKGKVREIEKRICRK